MTCPHRIFFLSISCPNFYINSIYFHPPKHSLFEDKLHGQPFSQASLAAHTTSYPRLAPLSGRAWLTPITPCHGREWEPVGRCDLIEQMRTMRAECGSSRTRTMQDRFSLNPSHLPDHSTHHISAAAWAACLRLNLCCPSLFLSCSLSSGLFCDHSPRAQELRLLLFWAKLQRTGSRSSCDWYDLSFSDSSARNIK